MTDINLSPAALTGINNLLGHATATETHGVLQVDAYFAYFDRENN